MKGKGKRHDGQGQGGRAQNSVAVEAQQHEHERVPTSHSHRAAKARHALCSVNHEHDRQCKGMAHCEGVGVSGEAEPRKGLSCEGPKRVSLVGLCTRGG